MNISNDQPDSWVSRYYIEVHSKILRWYVIANLLSEFINYQVDQCQCDPLTWTSMLYSVITTTLRGHGKAMNIILFLLETFWIKQVGCFPAMGIMVSA